MYNIETQESDILSINAEYSSKRGRNAGVFFLSNFELYSADIDTLSDACDWNKMSMV